MRETASKRGWRLAAAHEWCAHDPFGQLKPADSSAHSAPSCRDGSGAVSLDAARNGYVSFRLLVQGKGEYALRTAIGGGLAIDIHKAWYHRMQTAGGEPARWWPDALIPVPRRAAFELPDPENGIDGQTAPEFWVDEFVPADAEQGDVGGSIELSAGGDLI